MMHDNFGHKVPYGGAYSPWKQETRCNDQKSDGCLQCQLPPGHDSDHMNVGTGENTKCVRWER